MVDIEEHAKALNMKAVMVSLIISSFGFVAALFWRDAIQELIDSIVPEGQGLLYSFGAAIMVTIIAVAAIYLTARYLSRLELGDVKKIGKLKGIKNLKKKEA